MFHVLSNGKIESKCENISISTELNVKQKLEAAFEIAEKE